MRWTISPTRTYPPRPRPRTRWAQEAINAAVSAWLRTGKTSGRAPWPRRDVTDAPHPEAIGGLTVVDVPSREEALEWAAKIAVARRRAQEVRAIGLDPELDAMLRQGGR